MWRPISADEEGRIGARARATAGLVACGASVALALAQLTVIDLRRFAAANALSSRGRWLLLGTLAIGALAGLLVAAWIARRARATDSTAALSRAAHWAAPLLLAAAIPGLLAMDPWGDTLTLATLLGAVVVLALPLFRLHAAARDQATETSGPGAMARLAGRLPERWRRRGPLLIAAALACAYAGYFIFLTIRNHHKFNTFNWDLGQLDNQFYNALHGRPFRSTPLIREGNWSELRNHAEFTVFALLPFYALHPAASTLLVLQCLLLGGERLRSTGSPRGGCRPPGPCWWWPAMSCTRRCTAQLFDFTSSRSRRPSCCGPSMPSTRAACACSGSSGCWPSAAARMSRWGRPSWAWRWSGRLPGAPGNRHRLCIGGVLRADALRDHAGRGPLGLRRDLTSCCSRPANPSFGGVPQDDGHQPAVHAAGR